MKRVQRDSENNEKLVVSNQQYQPEQELVNDIFLNIARQSKWELSGLIARCSLSLLFMFLTPVVLIEIIGDIKGDLRNRLPKWLTYDFPAEYMKFPPRFKQEEIYASLPYKPQSRHEFITGGCITQKIYGLSWESDIDIYCHRGTYDNHNIENIDRIETTEVRLERVIENFDMSIVQQGYLNNKYYLTPLALYTFYTKDIIVCPCNFNITYRVPDKILTNNPQLQRVAEGGCNDMSHIKRNIWFYIHKHEDNNDSEHSGVTFDECGLCNSFIYDDIDVWRKRVKKYRKRFPEFTFTYCRPSTTHCI